LDFSIRSFFRSRIFSDKTDEYIKLSNMCPIKKTPKTFIPGV